MLLIDVRYPHHGGPGYAKALPASASLEDALAEARAAYSPGRNSVTLLRREGGAASVLLSLGPDARRARGRTPGP